jgi:uncharacterized membrane protein YgcG
MIRRTLLALLGCLCLSLVAEGPAVAQAGAVAGPERILEFVSQVEVRPDAGLLVTETIQVVALGRRIKRGIVREFPTSYVDRLGRRVRVGFKVLSARRDGHGEPYHLEHVSNGVKIYFGSKNRLLSPGVYTYQLTYSTDRQIGYFEGYDELYWNVTGNDWAFPIERAKAEVLLPPGAKVLQQAAYTGKSGAKGKDFSYGLGGDGRPTWRTTRPLTPGQGLTIAVAWPKGLVAQPSVVDDLLAGSGGAVPAMAGLLLTLAYYLLAWLKVGRDPRPDNPIPLFEPPQGMSPAAVRFVNRMGFDKKAVAAAVVSLAVKGYLTIEEVPGKKNNYVLLRTNRSPEDLSPGERRLATKLFDGGQSLELKQKNHARIGKAVKALRASLVREYEKANFKLNRLYLWPGVLLTLLGVGALVVFAPDPGAAAGVSLWLLIWTGGCYVLSRGVISAWRRSRSLSGGLAAVGATAFAVPFWLGAVMGLFFLSTVTDPLSVVIFLGLLSLTPLFAYLLKAPTVGGQRLMGQIAGFKLYLSVAEADRLNMLHPPEKTPELFERYLAYALALDVEQQWAEQFAGVLEQAGRDYQPTWYSGRSFTSGNFVGLTSQLSGSLAGAISSSSSAPGSSSGSGGGGSSGGGGGGGGGGGW